MFLRLVICLYLALISTSLLGQTLTSTVDRNQLTANQTLKLTVTYDGNTRTDALDLSAVRQDFDVLSSTAGTYSQLSNNQSSRTTNWELMLMPKRAGNLVIPSFNLGNIYSEAIQIEVVEAGQAAGDNDPMTVELSLDQSTVKVGEQVLIKIKLRAQASLADLAGEALKLEGADIQLVDQQDYGELQNGVNWRVIEWTYALFPQSSGSIAIPKQMFTATIPSTQRRSFFDSFATRGQRIARRSEAAVIDVGPVPDNTNDWFPASNVTISSSWTSDPSNLKVGEPLTRIVEISAESQLAAAIPPRPTTSPINYKEYQDQPALENKKNKLGITGLRRESSAIVPAQEGPIEFPEQVVRWWDINSDQWRESVLPAESYEVLPAVLDQSFSPPQNFEETPVFNIDSNEPLLLPESNTTHETPAWKWATMALIFVVIVQAIFLFRSRNSAFPAPSSLATQDKKSESEKRAWSQLLAALKSKDAGNIRTSLLHWSQARWPSDSNHTLETLAARSTSEEFKKALFGLDLILFKGASGAPSSNALYTELKKLRNAGSDIQPESPLAPLYPQPL